MCVCLDTFGSRSGLGRNRPVVRLLLLGLQGPDGWGESIRPRFMPLSVCVCLCVYVVPSHTTLAQFVIVIAAVVKL